MIIRKTFLLVVLLLSLVDGSLRLRLGIGLELSVLGTLILFFFIFIPQGLHLANLLRLPITIFILLILFINLIAYYTYAREIIIDEYLFDQIYSVEARIFAESLRLFACFFIFLFTIFYVNTLDRALEALRFFLFGAALQSLYGFYEFVIKYNNLVGSWPLFNQRSTFFPEILRPYGTFYEPSQFGQFMLVALLMLLFSATLKNSPSILNKTKIFFPLFLFFMLILSLSRAAFLVGMIVLVVKVLADVLSLSRERIINAIKVVIVLFSLFFCVLCMVVIMVPSYLIDDWVFGTFIDSADSETINTGSSRIFAIYTGFQLVIQYWLAYPLGIGEGVSIFNHGAFPFIFRLAIELGVLPFFLYIVFVFYILVNLLARGVSTYQLMPTYLATILIQFNYNTTNHLWIWFVIALVFAYSRLLSREEFKVSSTPTKVGFVDD